MILLSQIPQPQVVTIDGFGDPITITHRAYTSLALSCLNSRVAKECHRLLEAQADSEETGSGLGLLPEWLDQDDFGGLFNWVFARAYAKQMIESWDGVGEDAETPAPVTPANIDRLLNIPAVFEQYLRQIRDRDTKVELEGNGSGTSPDGAGRGVPNTAADAAPPTPPAPTANVE